MAKVHKEQSGSVWGSDIAAIETAKGLLFIANNDARSELADAFRSGGHPRAESLVIDAIGGNGLEFIPCEMLGLTEMPAFSEGLSWADDNGDSREWDGSGAPIYGYPDYMISDPWAALRNHGRVLFPIVERS